MEIKNRAKGTLGGFKQFILRGSVVDLAVGIVIGASFSAVVNSIVKGVITPLIGVVMTQPNFSDLRFTLRGSTFLFGDVINAFISFIILAAVIYFLVVLPVNALVSASRKQPPADPTTTKCPECKSEIPLDATRCAHCTMKLDQNAE